MEQEFDLYDEIFLPTKRESSPKEPTIEQNTSLTAASHNDNSYVGGIISKNHRTIYIENMYRLILTARKEMQEKDEIIHHLKKEIDARSLVCCPSCSHKFAKNGNRFLPKYVKVLRGTNRIELHFNDAQHLEDWLITSDLDRDINDLPLIKKPDRCTLADVGSLLPSIWSQQNSILKGKENSSQIDAFPSTDRAKAITRYSQKSQSSRGKVPISKRTKNSHSSRSRERRHCRKNKTPPSTLERSSLEKQNYSGRESLTRYYSSHNSHDSRSSEKRSDRESLGFERSKSRSDKRISSKFK